MKRPVIVIGLDSADPIVLEKWMAQGHLKNLARLREQGTYGRLTNMEYCKGETPWTIFLTGCMPLKTGYWSMFKLNEGTYDADMIGSYDFKEYRPFYALGDNYRVAAFDLPQALVSDGVNGIQVMAWGAHAPFGPSESDPKELFGELVEQYGAHPADPQHHRDRSDWYNPNTIASLKKKLELGLERRTAITKDLLAREPWDLFVTVIGETHTAMHYLWHLSQTDHPLYDPKTAPANDPMLEVFEKIDESLGEMLATVPEDAQVVVFSPHGMGHNTNDLLSMVLLPEFMYRFSFPGKSLLISEKMGTPPSTLTPKNQKEWWYKQIRAFKKETHPVAKTVKFLQGVLPGRLHPFLNKIKHKLMNLPSSGFYNGHPTMWYHPYWPKMKAFALPTFSEGYIRINLEGREPQGIVSPAEYDAVCDEIVEQLNLLTNPRTGRPIVKKIVRIRESAAERNPKLPDADLAVVWNDEPADVIDSPKYGRIGPVFYNRSGSHKSRGFLIAKGPGIDAGSRLEEGHGVDLAPTVLELMGAPIPEYFDGKPLVKTKVSV